MPKGIKISREEQDQIIQAYKNGIKLTVIVREFERDKSVIIGVLHRNGIICQKTLNNGRMYPLDETVFSEDTEDAMYWAGFLMADGCLHTLKNKKHRKYVKVSLDQKDKNHLNKFQQFLKTQRPLSIDDSMLTIDICSTKLFDELHRFGLTPRKSKTAKASEKAAKNRHFWRGVIDGDGSISLKADGRITLSLCGSKFLLEQYLCFIQKYVSTKTKVRPHKNIFEVVLGGIKAIPIIKELYRDCNYYLERKHERAILAQARFTD